MTSHREAFTNMEGQAEFWKHDGPKGWRIERRILRPVTLDTARAGRHDAGEVIVLRGAGLPVFDALDPEVLRAFLNRSMPAPF